jgi:hypothetical protein
MPEFTGRYRFRRVEKPKGDAALKGFTSGPDDFGVDALVRNQYLPGVKCERYPAIWIMEDVSQPKVPVTMGVSAWLCRGSPIAKVAKPLDEVYVHMIGMSESYRKCWLPQPDAGRLGRVLLSESLLQIKKDWSPSPVPAVWASVSIQNGKSTRMFGAYLFTRYWPVPGWSDDEAILWRPPKLGIP